MTDFVGDLLDSCQRRRVSKLSLAAALAAAAVSLTAFSATEARAGYAPFCPPQAFSSQLISANGRCASGLFYTMTQVQSSRTNGSGVQHCAVGKQSAGGLGGNVLEPTCNGLQTNYTGCSFDARTGYATQINQSASAHLYFGYASYGTGECLT